jgi:hypothetical protein
MIDESKLGAGCSSALFSFGKITSPVMSSMTASEPSSSESAARESTSDPALVGVWTASMIPSISLDVLLNLRWYKLSSETPSSLALLMTLQRRETAIAAHSWVLMVSAEPDPVG